MATQQKNKTVHTLDGNPHHQVEPFKPEGPGPTFEREMSGGLSDDPTESGEPVKNRYPFGKLSGGR